MQFGDVEKAIDYAELIQRFQQNLKYAGRIPISPEEVAEKVFEAAMDGSDRLRYPAGDAEPTIHMRYQVGEENFIRSIGEKFLSFS